MKCENCGRELPTHQSSCPYCGNSIIQEKSTETSSSIKIIISVFLVLVIFAIGIAGVAIKNKNTPTTASSSSEFTSTYDSTEDTDEATELEETTEPDAFDSLEKYDSGQYKVGSDISAGEYILFSYDDSGYFCVSSDPNCDDIIFNDNFSSNSIVEVLDGEYLQLNYCFAVDSSDFRKELAISARGPGNMLLVGKDIDDGEYKLQSEDSDGGYYCVYDSARHDSIISNDNFYNSSYVSVSDGEYLLLDYCHIVE